MYIGWVRQQEAVWPLFRHKVTSNVYEYHTVECVIFIQTASGLCFIGSLSARKPVSLLMQTDRKYKLKDKEAYDQSRESDQGVPYR